jgi:hypothetical protein
VSMSERRLEEVLSEEVRSGEHLSEEIKGGALRGGAEW